MRRDEAALVHCVGGPMASGKPVRTWSSRFPLHWVFTGITIGSMMAK